MSKKTAAPMISNGKPFRDSTSLVSGAAASVTTTTGCSTAGAASVGARIGEAGAAATSPEGAGALGAGVGFDDSGTEGRLPGSGVALKGEAGRAAGALVPCVAPLLEVGGATTLTVAANGVTVAPETARGLALTGAEVATTGVLVGVMLGRVVGVTVGVVPGSVVGVTVGEVPADCVAVAVAGTCVAATPAMTATESYDLGAVLASLSTSNKR